jgi:hypothetical protein
MIMKHSLDTASENSIPLDLMPEPFMFDLNWSASALIDAVNGTQRPHRFDLNRSADDATAHRPWPRGSFVAMPPLSSHFRVAS